MRIGILSDTHDRTEALVTALDLLKSRNVEYYIHCGDVGGQRILDLLAGLPVTFVWGNNDIDVTSLEEYAKTLNLTCGERFIELSLGGKSFAITHGDDYPLRQRLLTEQKVDYVLQGHTHQFTDQRFGKTRLINPGALHRAKPKTVAMLDTESDWLERVIVSA